MAVRLALSNPPLGRSLMAGMPSLSALLVPTAEGREVRRTTHDGRARRKSGIAVAQDVSPESGHELLRFFVVQEVRPWQRGEKYLALLLERLSAFNHAQFSAHDYSKNLTTSTGAMGRAADFSTLTITNSPQAVVSPKTLGRCFREYDVRSKQRLVQIAPSICRSE